MDKPLVSVIMPAFNAALYIGEAIESVINQTFRNWELLIVNDGSTDATEEIILDFEKKDRRIKYLFQENGKQGKARNLGIAHSVGKYIAFLDADDLWVSNKLAIQVTYLIANPEIDLIFSQGYSLNQNEPTDFDVLVKPLWTIQDLPLFIEKNQIPILSVVVKKKCLNEVSNFIEDLNIQYGEDYYLWLKLLYNNDTFCSINNRLFYYRLHRDQSTFNKNIAAPLIKMFELVFDSYENHSHGKYIARRIKWFLFEEATFNSTFELLKKIFIQRSMTSFVLLSLCSRIPLRRLKTKILFKLCP
ncbi:glycosyltransferase family 2 protein [Pedobacter sp. AJM]|uniref:glycosyltransferase family 2 protein n=1 Tax=Pedobacter sp. AJM TaxID=2003629 RepID=UPI000B4B7665|nr:glycosyltransferase family 2 protein [Pedobacter sp. AJM]OWK71758.1 hypothetical protein CBW18_04620 [Pedobacter sp. AJM]